MEAGPRVLRRAAVWHLNEATAMRAAGVAVGFGSTRDCTVHVEHPCGGQCRDLRLDALTICGDSRIAVDHTPIMHISFAQGKGNQINHIFFVQNS